MGGSGWKAQRPGIGAAFHGNVSYARVQHHTTWWFCFPFLRISLQRLTVMIVNADNTCEINVLWMRYSTLESQFYQEVHVPVVPARGGAEVA